MSLIAWINYFIYDQINLIECYLTQLSELETRQKLEIFFFLNLKLFFFLSPLCYANAISKRLISTRIFGFLFIISQFFGLQIVFIFKNNNKKEKHCSHEYKLLK